MQYFAATSAERAHAADSGLAIKDNFLEQPVGGAVKRGTDVILASLALVFFAPFMLVIAAIIAIMDPGPVLFAHKRIGHGRRSFGCLKFRSMVTNSQEVLDELLRNDPAAAREWRETQKLRRDPRITWIGRFLRVTSLDELPQLINVVRGDMSLVGPRPIVEAETAHYGPRLTEYQACRPGITGLWQVSGRSDCSYRDRIALDARYAREWSLAKDLEILFRTVGVVLMRRGSC